VKEVLRVIVPSYCRMLIVRQESRQFLGVSGPRPWPLRATTPTPTHRRSSRV